MGIDERVAWCPKCKTEYFAWAKTCSDCLVDLVGELPVQLPEEDHSLKNNPDSLTLLVSLEDDSEAEAITLLLATHDIPVTREQIEDDAHFGIGLYVSEPLMVKALTIPQREDDKQSEITSEVETLQDEHGGYTGLQLFKENFVEDGDITDVAIAPGKTFLKVTGILYLFSGLGIFTAFFSLPDLPLFLRIFLHSSYNVYMGIMAIKYNKSLDKAHLLCILAIADLLIHIFISIQNVVLLYTQIVFVLVLSVLISMLPILYLVGALKNRSAKQMLNKL